MARLLQRKINDSYKVGLDSIKGRLLGSHQHQSLKWMLSQEFDETCKGGILALDMGLGKTYVSISCIAGNKLNKPTLIVCPISILHQWRDLLISFGDMNPFLLDRNMQLKVVPEGVSVVITTYSMFTHVSKKGLPPLLLNTEFGRIMLDEGHIIKSKKSTTYVNINRIASDIKWIVTATPIQNSLKDISTLADFIGWKETHISAIDKFIDQKLFRKTMECEGINNPRLKLPDLKSDIVKLDFNDSNQQNAYKNVEKEFRTRIESTEDGPKLYTEALEGILRCRQVCCHPYIYQIEKKRKLDLDIEPNSSAKFQYICEDVMKYPNDKCLVFCIWTKEIAIIMNCLGNQGINALKFDGSMTREQRETTIYNFNNTGIRVLVVQINTGGVGLNLQAATRVYITSPTWNPCLELQAIARSHRMGQDKVVRCIRLIIKHTVEERILAIQDSKLRTIADCFDDTNIFVKMGLNDQVSKYDIMTLFS